jgi:hypothetical protein
MEKLLFAALTSFGRAFAITFIAFAAGILGATNLDSAVALSIAALAASLAAGLRAVQVFIPQLSFAELLPQPWAAYADAFVRMFLASFVTAITGWLAAPDWGTWHAALLGALTGAAVAAVRALQGLLTVGHSPQPAAGLRIRGEG